jgi:hypothetical protein
MQILLDQQSIEMEQPDVSNLEQILLKIMSDYLKSGNIITRVRLNGMVYSEEKPHDAATIELSDIKTLEIDTMAADEIAWQFLENGGEQLDPIIESAQKVSELFRIADESEANDQYAELLESLRLFLRMVAEVKDVLDINLAAIRFQNGTVEDRIHRLLEIMDQMLHVQEEDDWIMLADLLEYELVPLLKEWKSILPLLKEKKGN